MANVPVVEYRLSWNSQDNTGRVALRLHDEQVIIINVDSGQELAALAAILNEAPVTYNTESVDLFTGV